MWCRSSKWTWFVPCGRTVSQLALPAYFKDCFLGGAAFGVTFTVTETELIPVMFYMFTQVHSSHHGRLLLVAPAIQTCRVLHLNGLFHHATAQPQHHLEALPLMEEVMASAIHFPFSPHSVYIQMQIQCKYYSFFNIMI